MSAGDQRLTLFWEVPDDGGSPIIRYEYRYTSTSAFPDAWTEVPNGIALEPDRESHIIYVITDGLTNGTEYRVQMRAVNADGESAVEDDPADVALEQIGTTAANNPATGTLLIRDVRDIRGARRVPGMLQVDVDDRNRARLIADRDGLDSARAHSPHFEYVYRWFRVDGGTETPLGPPEPNGTLGSTYTLTDADAGKKIKVKVSFRDDLGNPEQVSAVYPSGDDTILPRVPCLAPSYTGGAVRIWSGALEIDSFDRDGVLSVYGDVVGGFTPDTFTAGAGGNTYGIDGVYRAIAGVETGKLVFGLTSDLSMTDQERLVLHVCDRAFRFVDASGDSHHDYLWDSDLDWSDVVVRSLYLSYDAVAPSLVRAEQTEASLKLTFDEDLDPDSVPARDVFTVKVGGAAADLAPGSTPAIAGGTVTLTLDSAPAPGSEVTVFYATPNTGEALRDLARNEVASFADRDVQLPQAAGALVPWLARLGRTVAGQTADAVASRFATPRRRGLDVRLGGQRLAGVSPRDIAELEARAGDAPRGIETRTLTGREFLAGSSFNLVGGTEEAGLVGVWGRVALAGFKGREDSLAIDGDVGSAMLGVDYTQGPAAIGILVSRAQGEGEYRSSRDRGTIESTLTGIYPYMRYAVSDRLSVWGTAGYGGGVLRLAPDNRAVVMTDMDMAMAAAGLRGVLQRVEESARLELAVVADALGAWTTSEGVDDGERRLLPSAEADVTRVRLGIEGKLSGIELGEHRFVPMLELAARHDGGDAESGYGLDIGVGLAWSAPRAGIEGTIRGRGLVSHEADGFRQGGGSVSLAWDPDPSSPRGPSLSLAQTVGGPARGGADAMLARRTSAGLAANDDGGIFESRRLEAKLGYGIAVSGGWLVATPEASFAHSETRRDLGLGWRMGLARPHRVSLGFDLRGTRSEAVNGNRPPEHGVAVRLTAGW